MPAGGRSLYSAGVTLLLKAIVAIILELFPGYIDMIMVCLCLIGPPEAAVVFFTMLVVVVAIAAYQVWRVWHPMRPPLPRDSFSPPPEPSKLQVHYPKPVLRFHRGSGQQVKTD